MVALLARTLTRYNNIALGKSKKSGIKIDINRENMLLEKI